MSNQEHEEQAHTLGQFHDKHSHQKPPDWLQDEGEAEMKELPAMSHTEYLEGTLVPSARSGSYTLDDSNEGHELTSGVSCEIHLGGHWIVGHVEHSGKVYALEMIQQPIAAGYYFVATHGGICGLCTGMQVRIPR
jgi:hypothetical protein